MEFITQKEFDALHDDYKSAKTITILKNGVTINTPYTIKYED